MKKLILLVTAVLLSTGVYAVQREKSVMVELARRAVNANRTGINRVDAVETPKAIYETDVYTMYKFANGAFAIVSANDLMPEILAYGDNAGNIEKNLSLRWWLTAVESKGQELMLANKPAMSIPLPDPGVHEPYVEPLVASRWDQDEPYWRFCPMDTYGRALTGCVATAISQVLYTNKYPESGIGEKSLTFNGQTVHADYENTVYRYDLMQDTYWSGSYSEEAADAVATLMLHAGIAVDMMYGADGSGAYSENVEPGLRNCFGIETARFHSRDRYSDDDWMEMVYSELTGGHPLYYDGVSGTGWGAAGHAFVCDGYDENGRVHINWGWSGKDDGYFDINLLDPSPYVFQYDQGMVTGMYDPNDVRPNKRLVTDTITVDVPGTLCELMNAKSDTLMYNIKGLKVRGTINAADLSFIRDIASGTELTAYGLEETGKLVNLDLRDVEVENDVLPAKAFKDAAILRRINMPKVLKEIGDSAFVGCNGLITIYSYAYDVPAMGKGVFKGLKTKNMKAYFIAGSSEAYKRNAQWKEILNTTAVEEFGTCVKARNYNRKEHEPNPNFGFTVVGEKVEGTPAITCEADESSPAGRYPIHIAPGTIEYTEDSNIVFVDGYLNVFEDKTGIEAVMNDAVFNVYTVDGVQVRNNATSISDLTPGIYVINGKKVVMQ